MLLEIPIDDSPDGEVIYVELTDESDLLPANGGLGERVISSQRHLGRALNAIRPLAAKVKEVLDSTKPSEVEVEFALKFSVEKGVILAKGTSEVNLVVRARWTTGG
jgi:hypothetical protein